MTGAVAHLERQAEAVLGRPLTAIELAGLSKYLNLLIKWQRSQRLVGSDEPRWIVDNVIIDSLLFRGVLPGGITTMADVGSGAGIPGVPLAIVLPGVAVALIEARQKRASFLSAVIREIALRNCKVFNGRLESLEDELARRFDAVVMRCAGNPTDLLHSLRRILVPGGVVVASGPPARFEVSIGSWVEIEGPERTRTFWVYHVT